jgi:hypothetical protein
MTRAAMMLAMAMLVSVGVTQAEQEPIAVPPASAVQGGTAIKTKTMTVVGAVKTVTADSLAITEGPGKDWTSVIDATKKIVPRSAQEKIDVAPASPIEGGKVIPAKSAVITDMKEGQRVEVKYHKVNGKMHATQVRAM